MFIPLLLEIAPLHTESQYPPHGTIQTLTLDHADFLLQLIGASQTNVDAFPAGLLGNPPVSVRTDREVDFMKIYDAVMSKVKQ